MSFIMRVVGLMDEPDWQSQLSPIEEIFLATSPSAKTLRPDERQPFKESRRTLDCDFRQAGPAGFRSRLVSTALSCQFSSIPFIAPVIACCS